MTGKKKIYIAGCGGMLGEAFYHVFSKNYDLLCTDIDVNEEWLSHLDFRDYQEDIRVRLRAKKALNQLNMPGCCEDLLFFLEFETAKIIFKLN